MRVKGSLWTKGWSEGGSILEADLIYQFVQRPLADKKSLCYVAQPVSPVAYTLPRIRFSIFAVVLSDASSPLLTVVSMAAALMVMAGLG